MKEEKNKKKKMLNTEKRNKNWKKKDFNLNIPKK